jgi:hypothetical protein
VTNPEQRRLVVLDSSVVIHLKQVLKVAEQWPFLLRLTRLVEAGVVGWPRYVRKEVAEGQYPDAPGAWIAGQEAQPFPEPEYDSVAEVLAVAQVVDAEAEDEVADPWVVAMALELRDRHPDCRVVVASDDVVDRLPVKESVGTACERLGLDLWSCEDFVRWVDDRGPSPGV